MKLIYWIHGAMMLSSHRSLFLFTLQLIVTNKQQSR